MKSLVALILALSLASCQFPGTFGGGSLRIQLPTGYTGRALVSPGDIQVRIQLVRNGIVVPLSGKDYLEQNLSNPTVTIDGLPTGKGFQLFVSIGGRPPGTTFFSTFLYQASGTFEISAGNVTAVSVTLGATRVKIVENEANADHATTFDGDSLYVIKGPNVHKMLSGDPSILPSNPEVSSYASGYSGLKVYSLVTDTSGTLLFNTNQGILSYNGETLGVYSNITPTPVVLTSAFVQVGEGSVFGGFQGPGLASGFSVGGTSWTLFPVGFFGFGGTPDYMYLATGLRTVRLTQSFLQTLFGSTDPAQKFMDAIKSGVDEVDALGESLTVSTSDGAQIGPLSVASDLSYSAYLFAGTKKGLYVGAVDPFSGAPFGTLGLVSSTSGQSITGLTTFPAGAYSGTVSYTAALSSTTREILLFANLDLLDRVRALEGLPSGDLQMQWYLDQTASLLYLLVSGSDATVAIPVATLPSGK